MNLSWQGFMILNIGGLLALSFFLGKLTNRVENIEREMRGAIVSSEMVTRLEVRAEATAATIGEIKGDIANHEAILRKTVTPIHYVRNLMQKDPDWHKSQRDPLE